MMGLTGPRTAVRGNRIAAVGMAIAVVATLLTPGVWSGSGTVILIIVGVAIGTAIGIPAARRVHMTAMPQMVAIFNGVGGGAVGADRLGRVFRHHFLHCQGFYPAAVLQEDLRAVRSADRAGSIIVLGVLEHRVPASSRGSCPGGRSSSPARRSSTWPC